MERLLLFVLVLFLSLCNYTAVSAQILVSGKVVDKETGASISKVNITCKATNNIEYGGVSEADGTFKINVGDVGTYTIRYSFLGYKTKKDTLVISGKENVSVGTVKLKPQNEELNEVKIEDQKKTVYDDDSDKRTYSPDDMQMQSGASAIEFLQTIPSLNVSNKGKVTLRGNSNVTVMIDGKLAGVSSSSIRAILENLPLSSIEKIEVYDNPSAKMNAQGSGGIINIITKKGTYNGLAGSVSLNIGIREKANGSAYISYRKKKIGVYGTYGYRYGKFAFLSTDSGLNRIPPLEWNYGRRIDGVELEGAHSGGFGLDWSPNVYNTITVSGFASYVYDISKSKGYYSQYFDGQPSFEYFERDVYQIGNELNSEGALLWTKKFKKPKQQWDTEINYGYNYDRTKSELGRLRSGETQYRNTDQIQRLHFASLRSDFVLPINSSMKFETGLRYTSRFISNDFDASLRDEGSLLFNPDTFLINKFRYNEHIAGFYGEFTHKIKKWKYRVGFRGEPTFINTYLENGNITNNRFYFGWFPFAGVYKDINKNLELKLTYARRISRPKPGSLNPFTDFSDPLDLRFGNPNLNPEYLNTIEFATQYKKNDYLFKGALFGRLYEDPFGRFRYLDSGSVVVTTSLNYKSQTQAGLELIGSAKFFKALTLTANVNLYYNYIDATDIQPGLKNSLFGYEAKFTAAWFLPKAVSGLFMFNYRGPDILVQGQTFGTWRMNISIRRSFFKNRLTLSASVQDIFNTWYGLRETRTYDVDRYSVRKAETRIIMAGLTFKFGKSRNANSDSKEEGDFRDRNNDIDK